MLTRLSNGRTSHSGGVVLSYQMSSSLLESQMAWFAKRTTTLTPSVSLRNMCLTEPHGNSGLSTYSSASPWFSATTHALPFQLQVSIVLGIREVDDGLPNNFAL